LPYKTTGNANGRPRKKERLDLRPGLTVNPKVRNWAILELATEERGFTTIGYLLDDAANKMRADLGIPEGRITARATEILERLDLL
jgi:hypothetical protein